jgi:hypothetical protein
LAETDCESTACSSGKKTLTSPADGLMVPKKATTTSGQNCSRPAKASPVIVMTAAAAISRFRRRNRCETRPNNIVNVAEPISVAVTTTPICQPLNPISSRYTGNMTLTRPSAAARRPRVVTNRAASSVAVRGKNRHRELAAAPASASIPIPADP